MKTTIILISENNEMKNKLKLLLKTNHEYKLVINKIPAEALKSSNITNKFIVFFESDKENKFTDKIIEILNSNNLIYLKIITESKKLEKFIATNIYQNETRYYIIDKSKENIDIKLMEKINNSLFTLYFKLRKISIDDFLEASKRFKHDDINDLLPHIKESIKSLLLIDDNFFQNVIEPGIKDGGGYNRAIKSLSYNIDNSGETDKHDKINFTGGFLLIMALYRQKYRDNPQMLNENFLKIFGDIKTIKEISDINEVSFFKTGKHSTKEENHKKIQPFISFIKTIYLRDVTKYNALKSVKLEKKDSNIILSITVNFKFNYEHNKELSGKLTSKAFRKLLEDWGYELLYNSSSKKLRGALDNKEIYYEIKEEETTFIFKAPEWHS